MIRARALSRETFRPRAPLRARSRQEARTAATRRRLLAAAAEVFARHGFEASRLEDIASLAGYTRGAFYANFQSKEDIFVTLLEQWVAERIAGVQALLDRHRDPEELSRALREYYAGIAKKREVALLAFEFKLFAIRHRKGHERLVERHARLRSHTACLARRVSKAIGHPLAVPNLTAAIGFSALSNALILEHALDSRGIGEQETGDLLGIFFDAILGTKPAK